MTKEQKPKQTESAPEEAAQVIQARPPVALAEDWRKFAGKQRQRDFAVYLVEEMRRVRSEGGPLLLSILSADEIPREVILRTILPNNTEFSVWKLALVPGATAPERDPHGCLLPVDKRGKVLAAKVGMRSDYEMNVNSNSPDAEVDERFSGPAMRKAFLTSKSTYQHKNSPYMVKEVSAEPSAFSTKEAIAVLRTYGFGLIDENGNEGMIIPLVMEVD